MLEIYAVQYVSTRGQAPDLTFSDVLLTGLARDGGLYVPGTWPQLSHADLRGTKLFGSDLSEAKLDSVNAEMASFEGSKLVKVSARKANMRSCLFVGADLSLSDFRDADLDRAQLGRARCEHVQFDDAQMSYADFSHADLSHARFSGATMVRTKFHRCIEKNTEKGNRTRALGTDERLARAEDWQPTH